MAESRAGLWLGVALLAGALALRTWVLGVVQVSTGSMEPGVHEGEVLLYLKGSAPKPGDVVVVRLEDELHVKRVVASGPAEVEVSSDRLYVDGQGRSVQAEPVRWTTPDCKQREEPGLVETIGGRSWPVARGGDHPRTTLAPGELWLLGDRRLSSEDSRQWGPAPISAVEGVVVGVLVSRDDCAGSLRWERLGGLR